MLLLLLLLSSSFVYFYHLNKDLEAPCEKKPNINNATMMWQPCKAETKHRLPEGIIKAQHDVQVVLVLKFRAESMGGPFQSTMS